MKCRYLCDLMLLYTRRNAFQDQQNISSHTLRSWRIHMLLPLQPTASQFAWRIKQIIHLPGQNLKHCLLKACQITADRCGCWVISYGFLTNIQVNTNNQLIKTLFMDYLTRDANDVFHVNDWNLFSWLKQVRWQIIVTFLYFKKLIVTDKHPQVTFAWSNNE